jgi:hypothetical protein
MESEGNARADTELLLLYAHQYHKTLPKLCMVGPILERPRYSMLGNYEIGPFIDKRDKKKILAVI